MYYWPMLGIRYAFYDYKPVGAPTFVGLKHFYSMFKTDAFWSAFRNTLELSIMKLLITTFTAVIVSIFLNEMGNLFAKKTLQTIIYLPHFMSWAVVASIFSLFLSPSSTGLVNGMLRDWGILAPDAKGIYFLASTSTLSISGKRPVGEPLSSWLLWQVSTRSCMKQLISTVQPVCRRCVS